MIGEILDNRYRIARLLGEGGMGAVYEAQHTETGRRVAVKVISAAAMKKPDAIERFTREVKVVGSVDTQHIVQVFDAGRDPRTGSPYMAMELLAGEDVQQVIRRVGPLCPDLALRIAAQACLGLAKAHDAGIVHRDVKPANLFLARRDAGEMIVKILDFGIAKILLADPKEKLTATGTALGTPVYMSPEQIKEPTTIDQRTDIWSLGAVLYESLTGFVPYHSAETIHELIMSICTRLPSALQDLAPWIPPEVVGVVSGAMQHDIGARFQSAAAMLECIKHILPQGWMIHEQALVPLDGRMRAFIAPRADRQMHVVERVRGGSPPVQAVSGFESRASVRRDGHAGVPEAGQRIAQGSKRSLITIVAAASAASLIAVGAVAAYLVNRREPGAVTTSLPPEKVVAEDKPPAVQETAMRRVRLRVTPDWASVEVDGIAVAVRDGFVDINGPLGTKHRVRIFLGEREAAYEVAITDDGPLPERVDLGPAPSAAAAASGAPSTMISPRSTRAGGAPPTLKAIKGAATKFE